MLIDIAAEVEIYTQGRSPDYSKSCYLETTDKCEYSFTYCILTDDYPCDTQRIYLSKLKSGVFICS